MINTAKTIGTAKTFDSAHINELLTKGVINNLANLEKAMFSLEYLGSTTERGTGFCFQGRLSHSSDIKREMDTP